MNKQIDAQRRQRAELYAQLASIESLDTFEEWKKLKLVEDAKQAGYEQLNLAARFQWEKENPGKTRLPTDPKFQIEAYKDIEKAWRSLQGHYPVPRMALQDGTYGQLAEKVEKGEPLPTYWDALQRAYDFARQRIGDFLKDGWILVRQKDLGFNEHWALKREKNGEVTQHYSAPDVKDEILFDLVQTLKSSPFPFRKCARCPTIFVPVRKQKFCSPACAARAFSSAENPERREYMRQRMEKKRKDAKELRRKAAGKRKVKKA